MLNSAITKTLFLTLFVAAVTISKALHCQTTEKPMAVIGYYMGDGSDITNYNTAQLTHIIYSFLHLKENKLVVDNANDSLAITKLVHLKKNNPDLKIILSLGGWGGCPTCTDVFNTETGRQEFAQSVLQLLQFYHADGLDLDWEYPAIASNPGYKYMPEDRTNFTLLVKLLRLTFGNVYELSFAAGGFGEFLNKSVEWEKVMPELDYVNLMTYDLVNGYSKRTGHLTSLFSTSEQSESTDFAIRYLDSIGVPMNKVVIGLAFYARLYSDVGPDNNGLYQSGKFSGYLIYKDFDKKLGTESGYTQYWDDIAMAPYAYNSATRTFATYDNEESVRLKVHYVKKNKLGGVMFWELGGDKASQGLLDIIYNTKTAEK